MLYRSKIVAGLESSIRQGTLTPGTYLPTLNQLADKHGIARNSVRHVYAALMATGLIEKVSGRGYRVKALQPRNLRLRSRLVPDDLWSAVEPLIPLAPLRPQRGGRERVDDRPLFEAMVFVLVSGCTWRQLPPVFDATVPTVYRRYAEWSQAGVWARLNDAVTDVGADPTVIHWANEVAQAALDRPVTPSTGKGP